MVKKLKPKSTPTCQSPDRHVAALVCGYPLPCPWHTVLVVIGEKRGDKKD